MCSNACLIVLLLVLLSTVGYFPTTPSSIITCFYCVVGASLILLFETRASISWLPHGRYLRSFCQNGSDRDDNDHDNNDVEDDVEDVGVLPTDVYREYNDNHPDVIGAQVRGDVVQKMNVFRFLYGRAGLYAFTGSMTMAMLMTPPTSSIFFSNSVTTMIYGLSIVVMVVDAIAFIVGMRAACRWTLIDTSIHCNSEHLREKFISASSTHSHNYDDAAAGMNHNSPLDQFEFSLLVMTLGLDMDENMEIPLLFGKFAKNPDCITFNEFHSWWTWTT